MRKHEFNGSFTDVQHLEVLHSVLRLLRSRKRWRILAPNGSQNSRPEEPGKPLISELTWPESGVHSARRQLVAALPPNPRRRGAGEPVSDGLPPSGVNPAKSR
jgi:hypothetical protein